MFSSFYVSGLPLLNDFFEFTSETTRETFLCDRVSNSAPILGSSVPCHMLVLVNISTTRTSRVLDYYFNQGTDHIDDCTCILISFQWTVNRQTPQAWNMLKTQTTNCKFIWCMISQHSQLFPARKINYSKFKYFSLFIFLIFWVMS